MLELPFFQQVSVPQLSEWDPEQVRLCVCEGWGGGGGEGEWGEEEMKCGWAGGRNGRDVYH